MLCSVRSNCRVGGSGSTSHAHSRRLLTNGGSGRSSLGSECRGQIGEDSIQEVRENMEAVHSGWRVPIKLINVELSLASYHGDTLEIHTQVLPRDLEIYCIISYVWSHEDDFAVDEVSKNKLDSERCDVTTTRRTITSCSLASFVAMLDICDQMGMKHVWIDCVCVLQDIEGVKSVQLAEMGYYYSRVTRCLVFLDGLNMYTPPIYQESKIGAWYDRVWIVQEAAYTYSKKIFLHALPPARTVLESSDIITFMRCRNEHVDLISRCLAQKKSRLVQEIPHDVSKWLLGLVHEENYPAFLNLLPNMSSEVKFCWTGWDRVVHLREKIIQSLNVKPNNVNLIFREALMNKGQDRVYSIMTLLGIELDVSYSRSLRDTKCKAAETMRLRCLSTLSRRHGILKTDMHSRKSLKIENFE